MWQQTESHPSLIHSLQFNPIPIERKKGEHLCCVSYSCSQSWFISSWLKDFSFSLFLSFILKTSRSLSLIREKQWIFVNNYFSKSVKMAIAYYIPQSHHQQSQNSTTSATTASTMSSSSESTITIPINQGGSTNTCWELLAKVFCFALRFCHQTPSQGVLRITFECQSQTSSSSSSTTTSENTTNKFKN